MAFDFGLMYKKGNMIPHVSALFTNKFGNEKVENDKNVKDKLPQNQLRIETRQDPLLNKIHDRIKQNISNNCSMTKRTFK